MRPGDLVFARKAKTQDYVAGLVVSDYRYEPTRERFQHVRSVRWLTRIPVAIPEVSQLITKAVTDITKFPNETAILVNALNIDMSKLPDPTPPEAQEADSLQPTNVIFYGPPGTGKTYKTKEHAIRTCIGADRYAEDHAEGDFKRLLERGQVEFTTFHQSYDYADFVVGFKPETVGDTMVFKPKPGLLLRLAKRARENPSQQYLLIMDEVNRGNISKIFGELITLIEKDKRSEGDFPLSVTLPCACPGYLAGENHDQFSLPSNVHFLGTMNTADRSIALLDTALRRRFRFKEMAPDPKLLPTNLSGINLKALLEKLNTALREKLTRDHQIGHAWLPMITAQYDSLNPAPSAEAIAQEINEKIMPLIDEWFYENVDGKKAALKGLAKPSPDDADKFVVTPTSLKEYAGA
jgi:5-methylcytosine-specific restriction endonuclease McrBC GTP-binding regulatory subunit McrB